MHFPNLVHIAAVTLILAPASAMADRNFAVELATPPVWFFKNFFSQSGEATCTAVNLHDKQIKLTTRLIYHSDDDLPFPINPDPFSGDEVEQELNPGEATALASSRSLDALLARCVFEYQGDPRRVKAAIILDEEIGNRSLTAPAELVKKVKLRRRKK